MISAFFTTTAKAEAGENIITDGLVFNMDFSNADCYPGSGTTVTDLVGSLTGTVQNGASFSSDFGGVFDFDGVTRFTNVLIGSGSGGGELYIGTTAGLGYTVGVNLTGNLTASGNISASGNFIGNEITGSKLAITNGSFLPQPSGYSGLSTIINGGAYFQIVNEAEKVFGISSLAAGVDILRIDNDPLRFTIDPDNEGFNFGIRTSTPSEALTVNGNISASGNIRIDGNNGLQLDANNSRIYYDSTAINISPGDSDILAVGENGIKAEAPITASIVSASGQIIGDVVDTSFENFLNFEAATAYTYIAPFPLTVNFTGSSTSSMEVVGFVTASANTDTFSVQQGLPITLNRFDKLKITPSSSGLFTFSGSRTI